MAIKLFTGLPGAGKSLSLVQQLSEMHKREPGRPVYAYGIDGLKDGLAEPCDPRKWQDLPDGSIVVVDEAQKVWPSRRAGDPPPDVAAFSEHRHRGFDFLIATQNPKFIDSYLRGLGEEHTHVVRRWGGKTVDRYIWQECQEDVKSRSVRASGQRQRWKYPKECYDMYKSSTMHTVKRRLPWQWWVMMLCIPLAVGVGYFAWTRVYGLRNLGRDSGTAPPVAAGAVESARGYSVGAKHDRWATVADYVKDHIPRIAGQPWSAPVFDQEAIKASPDLLCIEYHRVIAGRDQQLCSCYTEQVTPYELHSLEECRRYARNGVYNPRRAPVGGTPAYAQGEQVQGAGRRPEPGMGAPATSPGEGGAWQPAWRTGAYVQPERTRTNNVSAFAAAGGG